LDVKWNKRGDKFSAATGSKLVAIGYYEADHQWWTAKLIKEHKSSVTSVKFDSLSLFVISGSTDLKAYISSAYLPQIDDNYPNENPPFPKVSNLNFIYIYRLNLEKL
jgi:actin related protein 2/3 complex subunit 1A/1B